MGTLHRFETRPRKSRRRPRRAASTRGWLARAREAGPILIALPLAGFCAVWFADLFEGGPPAAGAAPTSAPGPARHAGSAPPPDTITDTITDTIEVRFAPCGAGARVSCVVDGDTIWLAGEKIRLADINAPETSDPACAREAELGARATARLTTLLNQAPFALARDPSDRDEDRYGRKLRVLTREGESLGDTLVREGLAEEWRGFRREWC